MTEAAEAFYEKIPADSIERRTDLIDYFVYFLTIDQRRASASSAEIARSIAQCRLPKISRLNAYLSEGLRGKPPRYIKSQGGYCLTRHRSKEIEATLNGSVKRTQAGGELSKLLEKLPDGQRKDFLQELIDCFKVGANRATIIMCWLLAVDCLYDHIQAKKLSAFNAVLATNTDKRVKITTISHKDDFSEIPEGKFIEFCRQAGVISNDVRKILEEKLGTRNSCAHPSGVVIKSSKVIEFVEDLVTNVVLKYF